MLHKFEILIIIIKNTNVSNLRDLILVIAKYSPSLIIIDSETTFFCYLSSTLKDLQTDRIHCEGTKHLIPFKKHYNQIKIFFI